ncbi:membrane protein insertion efficiency factor YidD [Buchnera aphidicola (Aphis craccivora)]|uniref:Membrane protein insertion efficiency factor YidD n=1 Tax=Buchnera aphidicola (Aphis craccivora) TaxID=466616 RepID=A0A4D6XMU1_9GAMM|nr:membrane protein insertion efficiency factor YidD [Buchnera aphidicola]QCI16288.1 membrane protein insertion efficiency factor YidD [Buchnera aphidicola (Aphis craccivora)]QLL40432.1 membrane protein insertion efficiency factor YidD [Buchnera aphidicola (Aphis craccivore)]WAI17803.1 MAG: membrane protein insertion efficiency factor YidD [Buchnera aphidicola (Aphis craccivora)]
MGKLSIIVVWCFSSLILIYQYCISPFMRSNCRFYPTCSTYMLLSLRRFGVIKGILLTILRLFKCHPLHSGKCN